MTVKLLKLCKAPLLAPRCPCTAVVTRAATAHGMYAFVNVTFQTAVLALPTDACHLCITALMVLATLAPALCNAVATLHART